MHNKVLDCIALTVAIIGAVNWGLIGFFDFNLVAAIFGSMSWISYYLCTGWNLWTLSDQFLSLL